MASKEEVENQKNLNKLKLSIPNCLNVKISRFSKISMKKNFTFDEKIFIAGVNGMVGSAILRKLKSCGYGNKKNGGVIYSPSSKELNLLNYKEVDEIFGIIFNSVLLTLKYK